MSDGVGWLNDRVKLLMGAVAVVGVIAGGTTWKRDVEVQVADNSAAAKAAAKQIELLTDIHKKQQTAQELIRALCASGDLTGPKCAGLPTPPPKPPEGDTP